MFKINISPEEIEALPLTSFPGEIIVVDKTDRVFWDALKYLKEQKIIGFDTETRPSFSPEGRHNKTALLQLSGEDRCYLFRVQKLVFIKKVYRLLACDDIIKVGAATANDVRGLQKFCKFNPDSFVDLQNIVWQWGIKDKSVKKMAANILGIRISKTQQLSNWEARTLSEAQKRYAATDAWVCREMYVRLMQTPKHPLTSEQINPNQHPRNDSSKDHPKKG